MKLGLLSAACGTAFTFLMTTLGAAVVLLFRKCAGGKSQKAFLGFASGVMIAASIWSLIIPCVEKAEESGMRGYIPAAGGFILGVIFMLIFDRIITHFQKSKTSGTVLLITAITVHNIPEGMAVGLSFALAALSGGKDFAAFAPAIALALGIGIQNFPEGAAVSLPLRQNGMSCKKALGIGALSGIVEPIFGILAVLIAGVLVPYLPWLLSFAAGAMLYVVVEELVPEAHDGEYGKVGTIGAMAGFLIMMVLDIALG
ncbi:MAG: ZIP family metal transporter [Oscillospiraceae bacterium]